MKKNLKSCLQLAQFFFSIANKAKTSPNLNFCSLKIARHATYVRIMTLIVNILWHGLWKPCEKIAFTGRKSTPTPKFLGTTEEYFVILAKIFRFISFILSFRVSSPCTMGDSF